MIHPEVAQHIPVIRRLCQEFGVERLEIFGSAVTDAFDPKQSDVDFLVTYPTEYDFGPWAQRLHDFESDLSGTVGRAVDVVISKPQRNRFFARDIDRTRQDIYVADGKSGGATTLTRKTAHAALRPAHQRTLKLLEDIRLACMDVEGLTDEDSTRASLSDRVTHDTIAWSIQKTGMCCRRLEETDAETASRIAHLSAMTILNEQLSYGSGVDVDIARLYDAAHYLVPEMRQAVTTLIEHMEQEEGAASTGARP